MASAALSSAASLEVLPEETPEIRLYEGAILYPTTLPPKEEQELVKEVEETWKEAGGKLVEKDVWGRRGLAYLIRGHAEGKFIIYYFELDPGCLKEIDGALRIQRHLLRHMIVKPPKGYVIRKYNELYEQWMKERETLEDRKTRESKEKHLEQVARKAKLQVQRMEAMKKKEAEVTKKPLSEEQISEQIEKLISDDTLEL